MPGANSEEIKHLSEAVAELGKIAAAVSGQASNDQFLVKLAVQGLQGKIEALGDKLDQLVNVVAQQADIIRRFENERYEIKGAQGAVKFIWGALVAGVGAVAYVLHDVVTIYFAGGRSH